MEVWFWLAVGSAIGSGLGNFTGKVAAHRGYDTGLIIFYSALLSGALLFPIALIGAGVSTFTWMMVLVAFGAGLVSSMSGIFKIQALKSIDTTIFFPLFKLVGPLITIVFGMLFFAESHTGVEWIGLVLSLFIPLLLITNVEKKRQKNLMQGLVLVVLAGVTAAIFAAAMKYAVDVFQHVLWIVAGTSIGVFTGGLILFLWQNRNANLYQKFHEHTSKKLLFVAIVRGTCLSASFFFTLYALSFGGPLGIVYTINSLYILIPIVLSIIFYNEHWNTQKVIAIVLSILALGLLG